MLKENDLVVIHTCGEAEHYEGKLLRCTSDQFAATNGSQVIFLDGVSGYFSVEYLQKVDLTPISEEIASLKKELETIKTKTHINNYLQELIPNENEELILLIDVHGVQHTLGITERDARAFNHAFQMKKFVK